jgi:hypothetical protein
VTLSALCTDKFSIGFGQGPFTRGIDLVTLSALGINPATCSAHGFNKMKFRSGIEQVIFSSGIEQVKFSSTAALSR